MNQGNSDLLNTVIESVADGIIVIDENDVILHYNVRYLEIWNIPPTMTLERMDSQPLEYIQGQFKDPQYFSHNVALMSHDQSIVLEDVLELKNGTYLHRYTRPLFMNGSYAGRLWKFTDITELKKSQGVFQAITDLSPDIVSILDQTGTVVFNSAIAEKIHGYTLNDLVGRNTMELIHIEDRSMVEQEMRKLLANTEYLPCAQYRYRNKDGSYIWMEARASNQLANPSIKGIVVISRVISERKKLEQELQEAVKVRDEFLSVVSHELKTPVTSIKLRLQMIERKKKAGGVASEKDIWGLIDQINSVQRLINDLLYVTKIKTGQLDLDLHKEHLAEIIESSFFMHQQMLSEANVSTRLDLDQSIEVLCDKLRIQQVLTNLTSNVAKYASGAPLEIGLKREKEWAIITMRDYGQGIPEAFQKSIFELFSRGQDASYLPGLGIGLFISRSIISQHKGSLELISEPGKGATFLIRLPLV